MIDVNAAKAELTARYKSRRSIVDYVVNQGMYTPAKHHEIILRKLQEMLAKQNDDKKNGISGHGQFLIINTPPGMAKSTYASFIFPVWAMSVVPQLDVIHCMNEATLAQSFGRKIRNVLREQRTKVLLNTALDPTNSSSKEFGLMNESKYKCSGVAGSITGRRARLGIIDDPNKSAQQALNKKRQSDIWQWFESEFLTRLVPNYLVVLILTRWSEDDLAGMLLKERPKQCTLLKFEAICEDEENDPLGRKRGEGMWQEYLGKDWFHEIKKKTLPWVWDSLYQQNPKPQSGGIFQRSWFEVLALDASDIKANKSIVFMTSDFGVTAGGGDFTEFAVWIVNKNNDLIAVDWWCGQKNTEQWVEVMLDMVARWQPYVFGGEKGVIQKAAEPTITRRMRERAAKGEKVRCAIEWIPSTTSKRARAFGLEQRAFSGKVKFADRPWTQRVVDQLEAFTGEDGGVDDAVDCCSMAVNMLDEMPIFSERR